MRVTSRFWAVVALGGVLTGLGLFLERPTPIVGAAGLGLWIFALQSQFVQRTRSAVDGFTVVQRSSRERVVKGEPFVVTLDASIDHDTPLTFEVVSQTPVSATGVSDGESRCRLEPRDETASTTFTMTGAVAGKLTFDPPEVTMTDPMGLFEETETLGEPMEVRVEAKPPRYLHVGAGGERLQIGYGEHNTALVGTGLEPAEVTEYSPGNELRRIDWKATARLNYPHIRKYERHTPRRVALIVDHRAAMGTGSPGKQKLDYARDVALLFLSDAQAHEDLFSLYAVGDEGVTVAEGFAADMEHYLSLRRRLDDLTPTSSHESTGSQTGNLRTSTGHARRLADRLDSDPSLFARRLRPYFSQRDAYISRVGSRPLFSTVRAHMSDLRQSTWTILVTDDTGHAEIHDTVKLARQGGGHVAVFLTPSALFEPRGADTDEAVFQSYREFEHFRRQLTEIPDVTAFEVGPGKRLEKLLSAERAVGVSDRNHGTRRSGGVR